MGEHLKFERKDTWDMKWADVSIIICTYLVVYSTIAQKPETLQS